MKIKTSGNFNSKQSINLQNAEDNERRYHRSKPQQSPCSDIQALPQRISEELQRNNPETSTLSQKLDDDKLTELISQAVDVALQSRLYDDEKYVDKLVSVFTELANMYNTVTANCNKNAETLNRNIQLTEKRYAAMMELMQEKKSKAIEQPPIPQPIKALPRFIFLTYPWYWIKKMYRSKHFRQFLVICMACAFAVSVFLTIFLAYDNAQLRGCYFHSSTAWIILPPPPPKKKIKSVIRKNLIIF